AQEPGVHVRLGDRRGTRGRASAPAGPASGGRHAPRRPGPLTRPSGVRVRAGSGPICCVCVPTLRILAIQSPRTPGRERASRRKKTKAALTVAELASIAKARPYIERVIEDATLRENIRTAVDSTRSAYGRMTNGKTPTKALIEDKKLQADLRDAADA